jgi:eukaryotic-like serine/threonine-protein kinase
MDDARRYRLLAELGRGGMGVVWRAHDERLDREVAVKVVHDWVAADPELRGRFEREAAALARLQHPHVVHLYDVVEAQGRTLLVMELVEGESLAQLIGGRTLEWEDARAVVAPIAAALAYAHAREVVHRDLTPANVLVERGSGRVVVSDFGLARLARGGSATQISGVLAGTPEYWSPEQAAGRDAGPETDLYALGCLLYRLLAGTVPFPGDDRLAAGLRRIHEDPPRLAEAAPDVPVAARRLVDSLLDRDPARRPSAAEAAQRLGVPPQLATGAPPAGPADREALTLAAATFAVRRPHRARRGRLRLVALGTGVAAALAGGGVYAIASMDPPGIAAPAVVGDSLARARAEVAAAARDGSVEAPRVQVVRRQYSEEVPAGAVLAQAPGPGSDVPATGALLLTVSLGSAWASVPDTYGEPTRDALRELGEAGFTPVRRYEPSLAVPAWHVAETRPAAGSRLKRPAQVEVFVSTGPPRAPVPDLRGSDLDEVLDALERAGFATSVDEAASSEEPGTVLELSPAPGTRTPVGSTVTVVVAREPRWETVREFHGEDDATTDEVSVPAGARVVLAAQNTSFLGYFDGSVDATWSGDDEGSDGVDSGSATVLVEPADSDRRIAFELDTHGHAQWELRVEAVS